MERDMAAFQIRFLDNIRRAIAFKNQPVEIL
jgi:hypothetical protein